MTASTQDEGGPTQDAFEFSYTLTEGQFLDLQWEFYADVSGGRRTLVALAVLTTVVASVLLFTLTGAERLAVLALPLMWFAGRRALLRTFRESYRRLFAEQPVVRWRFDATGVTCFHRSGDLATPWSEVASLQTLPRMHLLHRRSVALPLSIARKPLGSDDDARVLAYLAARGLTPGPAPASAAKAGLAYRTVMLWLVLVVIMTALYVATQP